MSEVRRTGTLLVRQCCLSGLLGSVLFLSGDMLFYGNWSSGADFHAYHEMAARPLALLVIGGALGPVAALFSAFGMGIFYLTLKSGGWINGSFVLFFAIATCVFWRLEVDSEASTLRGGPVTH
jgi:hypothetical protein